MTGDTLASSQRLLVLPECQQQTGESVLSLEGRSWAAAAKHEQQGGGTCSTAAA